jgi:hypothetical protein
MLVPTERRQQRVKTTVIDHAIDLVCTHGLSYASTYLRNQKFGDETIARVLSGSQDQHRKHDCSDQHAELPYASESQESENAVVRQLSYSSRSGSGNSR